jgi:hypothetical protein
MLDHIRRYIKLRRNLALTEDVQSESLRTIVRPSNNWPDCGTLGHQSLPSLVFGLEQQRKEIYHRYAPAHNKC